jgi:hypothetical protein
MEKWEGSAGKKIYFFLMCCLFVWCSNAAAGDIVYSRVESSNKIQSLKRCLDTKNANSINCMAVYKTALDFHAIEFKKYPADATLQNNFLWIVNSMLAQAESYYTQAARKEGKNPFVAAGLYSHSVSFYELLAPLYPGNDEIKNNLAKATFSNRYLILKHYNQATLASANQSDFQTNLALWIKTHKEIKAEYPQERLITLSSVDFLNRFSAVLKEKYSMAKNSNDYDALVFYFRQAERVTLYMSQEEIGSIQNQIAQDVNAHIASSYDTIKMESFAGEKNMKTGNSFAAIENFRSATQLSEKLLQELSKTDSKIMTSENLVLAEKVVVLHDTGKKEIIRAKISAEYSQLSTQFNKYFKEQNWLKSYDYAKQMVLFIDANEGHNMPKPNTKDVEKIKAKLEFRLKEIEEAISKIVEQRIRINLASFTRFYIAQKLGPNSYEIVLGNETALLTTTSTQFGSSGYATMDIRYSHSQTASLKTGFNRQLRVFVETDPEIARKSRTEFNLFFEKERDLNSEKDAIKDVLS